MKVSAALTPGPTSENPMVLAANCPSRVLLEHVTSKWGVLILIALAPGTLRWADLRRRVEGVSEKMLSQTLRTLEQDGLVRREPAATVPPRVDYTLTPLGQDLTAVLLPLVTWIGVHANS